MVAVTALLALAASAFAAPAVDISARNTASHLVSNPGGQCAGALEGLLISGMSIEFTECDPSKKQEFTKEGNKWKVGGTPNCLEDQNGIVAIGNCDSRRSDWVAGYLPGTISHPGGTDCMERDEGNMLVVRPCTQGTPKPQQMFHSA